MTQSVKGLITTALRDRLTTITTANGYATNVQNVFFDKIPMGLNLQQHELPAIILIQGVDNQRTEIGCVIGDWEIELQLWHCEGVSDCEMNDFERDVYKAIYANSATKKTSQAYKIHPSLVDISPSRVVPDLNMIDSNRVSMLFFNLEYRTPLYNM